ncbi:hypothetical protein AMEX_G5417 [Astyanax mexicanus]|uniref:Uncharacterized protein n=1 Tax=Astyanax mexicanus TaxID=7994 RepID=A0A8T2ME91_ASTMX|nr:hypothetical protein AMEX_G5417 [Astyanax mexicanus]
MESDTTGGQSHLLNSMRSYLCNPKRAQPIIGLDCVIELYTDTKPPVYICDGCVLKINKTDIKTHIMGSLHRYNYIRLHHVCGLRAEADLTSLAWHLMELAKYVEKKEGPGNVQVLKLDEDLYMELISQPVPDVLAQVKEIKKQALINKFQSTVYNKVRKNDNYSAPSSAAERSSPERSIIQSRSPPPSQIFHPDPSEYPAPTRTPNPTKAFSSEATLQIGSPGSSPELSDVMHKDEVIDESRDIDACSETESHMSNTVQTAKRKRVAQCQNSSLTVTITQQTNQENISSEEISQEVNNILKLIRSQGVTETDQYQHEDDPSITKAFSNSDWVLNSSNGAEQEEEQPVRSFSPEDTYFRFESTGPEYPIMSSECEQAQDHSQTWDVQPPNFSDESPESYTGTQPLIGLQTVIKCQSVDGDPPPCCYLCQPCSLKVLSSDIIQHLINPQHYFNYIKVYHAPLLVGITGEQSLQIIAIQLEKYGGRGQMKVTRLSACLFSEVLERDYHWCMKMLNCGSTKVNRQGTLMESPSGHSTTKKLPDESAQISLTHGGDGPVHEPSRKLLVHQHKSKKNKARRKNVGHMNPVFKVSLSLKEGPVVVDRTSLITATTVAPEIEHQDLEDVYLENVSDSVAEYMTSENHILPEEYENTEQNHETFSNTESSNNKHPYPEQPDPQTLTVAEMGSHSYRYMNQSQFLQPVQYTEPFVSGNMNNHPGPETYFGPVYNNTFVKDAAWPTTSDGCPATHSVSDWVRERQPQPYQDNACNWPMERGPFIPSYASNWHRDDPMFVQSERTQAMYANQVPHQMLGERTGEMVHFPMHTYPAEVGAYGPYYPRM